MSNQIQLSGNPSVVFDSFRHHSLLWRHPQVPRFSVGARDPSRDSAHGFHNVDAPQLVRLSNSIGPPTRRLDRLHG